MLIPSRTPAESGQRRVPIALPGETPDGIVGSKGLRWAVIQHRTQLQAKKEWQITNTANTKNIPTASDEFTRTGAHGLQLC